MKLLSSILLVLSMSSSGYANSETIIHDSCWDGTFAYNYMTVIETEDKLVIKGKGSTILPVISGGWGAPRVQRILEIDKDNCSFS